MYKLSEERRVNNEDSKCRVNEKIKQQERCYLLNAEPSVWYGTTPGAFFVCVLIRAYCHFTPLHPVTNS